ncbi:MAG: M14 family zinc carboxypeptidase [Woeseiaceae bacterium]|nr:M14 family zinc carboxypeptidase [Woeseiaceae bacterium]
MRNVAFAVLLLAGGCALTDRPAGGPCASRYFQIDADFDGGAYAACRIAGRDAVELTFRPEDPGVSGAFSWYAFRATAGKPRNLDVRLLFPGSYARFWPKLSDDGTSWRPAAVDAVSRGPDNASMQLRIEADADGTWVSAQELLGPTWYEVWLDNLDARPDVETAVVGTSVEARPIPLLRSAAGPETVILLGRQHPVEVPGALAMRRFVDVLLADTPLARRFRERFTIVVLPLINPDGVVNGHARHNAGGTDLNRDWGPFTQPETASVAALLDDLDAAGIQPRLMLDFHATRMTSTMLFYTQTDEDDTDPPGFAGDWLGRVDDRIDDYEFEHAPRAPSGQDNAKNYFFSRYGIPSITYEIGDEADRAAIHRYTPVFAEEMMRVLLEAD